MFEDKILFYAMRHEKTTEDVGGLVEVLHILTGFLLPPYSKMHYRQSPRLRRGVDWQSSAFLNSSR